MKLQLSDGTFLTLDDKYTDDQALKLWYSAEDQLKAGNGRFQASCRLDVKF